MLASKYFMDAPQLSCGVSSNAVARKRSWHSHLSKRRVLPHLLNSRGNKIETSSMHMLADVLVTLPLLSAGVM